MKAIYAELFAVVCLLALGGRAQAQNYVQFTGTTQCSANNGFCELDFAAFPVQKEFLVQTVSCSYSVIGSQVSLQFASLDNSVATAPLQILFVPQYMASDLTNAVGSFSGIFLIPPQAAYRIHLSYNAYTGYNGTLTCTVAGQKSYVP